MRKILLLLALIFVFVLPSVPLLAQVEKELLLEVLKQQTITNAKVDKLSEQVAEVSKQTALTNIEVKSLEKAIDKRFEDAGKRVDILLYIMIAILTGIFGLMALIVWDRRAVAKPFEDKTEELKKEIALLKEKEQKFEEKMENSLKQIDARFAGIS